MESIKFTLVVAVLVHCSCAAPHSAIDMKTKNRDKFPIGFNLPLSSSKTTAKSAISIQSVRNDGISPKGQHSKDVPLESISVSESLFELDHADEAGQELQQTQDQYLQENVGFASDYELGIEPNPSDSLLSRIGYFNLGGGLFADRESNPLKIPSI